MEGLISFLLFAVFFYLLMRVGCGAHGVHGHGTQRNDIDPVCGMEVGDDQGYERTYQGKRYRFCTPRCLDKFEENPQQYINAPHPPEHGGHMT